MSLPWYESTLLWGCVGLVAAVVLTVIGVEKDLRWLLLVAWPFSCIALWAAFKNLESRRASWLLIVGASILAGGALDLLNDSLRHKPTRTTRDHVAAALPAVPTVLKPARASTHDIAKGQSATPQPAIRYRLDVSPSFDVRPDGNVDVQIMLINSSAPAAELHNITGEFWADSEWLIQASRRPDRTYSADATGATLPFVYYDFQDAVILKHTGAALVTWIVRRPEPGRSFPFSVRVACSEVDWSVHSWRLVNDGQIKLVSAEPTSTSSSSAPP